MPFGIWTTRIARCTRRRLPSFAQADPSLPLSLSTPEPAQFATASTDTLAKHIDDVVHIGGIVGQLKKSKIKKGPNEGKLMAKFVLDDQFGSVDVVVFSDLYQKHARWLENGVPVLLTAAVKDTGGMIGGRSAALSSAEQQAQQIHDEYGGHPESEFAMGISGYDVDVPGEEDERDEKEKERDRIGADVDKYNLGLFGSAPVAAPKKKMEAVEDRPDNGGAGVRLDVGELRSPESIDEVKLRLAETSEELVAEPLDPEEPIDADEIIEVPASIIESGESVESVSSRASSEGSGRGPYSEPALTPELNALDITPLEGIRDRRVKELLLEVSYEKMNEESIKKIREIFERHPGEIPVSVTLRDVPPSLASSLGATASGSVRMRLNQHFRVQPGPALASEFEKINAGLRYAF